MRHVKGIDLHKRFPGISGFLARYGLDLQRDLIPVRPAAHYLMGGIRTDVTGRTSRRGLFAAGEAACTGVHGANRLASNSLLEGLVFGARAAKAMLEDGLARVDAKIEENAPEAIRTADGGPANEGPADEGLIENHIAALQRSMWANAGLLREEASLRIGLRDQKNLEAGLARLMGASKQTRRLVEGQALCSVAGAILGSGFARTESRGAHFRNDFPRRDDENFRKHSVLHRDGTGEGRVAFEEW
jgi:L-aspartate oxidase